MAPQARGAQTAEARRRRWERFERNAETEAEEMRARRAHDRELARDPDLDEVARKQPRDQ